MQICKLYFILVIIIVFSALVSAGSIVSKEGELKLEGKFDINSSEDSTAFISNDGNSIIMNQPLEEISLNNDSLENAEVNYIEKVEVSQEKSKVFITGAVVDSKFKNYIIPLLIIIAIILGLLAIKIMRKNKTKLRWAKAQRVLTTN